MRPLRRRHGCVTGDADRAGGDAGLAHQGAIGNGGFDYLFEGRIPGDPDYKLSIAAYRTIGCHAAADAFEAAIALFPGGVVPADVERPSDHFYDVPEHRRRAATDVYYGAVADLDERLAAYVLGNRATFGIPPHDSR